MGGCQKVDPALVPYLRRVMTRCYYTGHFHTEEDGTVRCKLGVSSDAFHKMVLRARCEKAEEENPGQHYITASEAKNNGFLNALFGKSRPDDVVIIGCSEDDPEFADADF